MFYAEAFPESTPSLSAERALAIEFDAMCLLLQADRDFLRRRSPEGLVRELLLELEFCGIVDEASHSAAVELLERNAAPLFRFVANHVLAEPAPAVLEWLHPDPQRVTQHLGRAANRAWQQRASEEAESITGEVAAQRTHAARQAYTAAP